jgi:hypothetical protein
MLMSLKNDQPRCCGEDHISPHKDYNSSYVISYPCLMIADCANPFPLVLLYVSSIEPFLVKLP